MSFRVALAAATAALIVAAAPAEAAINFNTTTGTTASQTVSSSGSGLGNSYTFVGGGVTMTAVGFSLSGAGGTFSASETTLWSGGGLGTCNSIEGSGCSSPSHQVDNAADVKSYTSYPMKDFVLLTFSTALTIEQIKVATSSGADTDVTYYLGNIASNASLVGATLASLTGMGFGAATTVDGAAGSGAVNTANTGNAGKYNAILVGTPTGQTDDAWKFQAITVTPGTSTTPPTGVPEPMSLMLLATGLIGLGAATRQRRKA